MLQHLVEDLGRLQFLGQFARDRLDHRVVDVGDVVVRDGVLVDLGLRHDGLRPVGVQVVEDAPGLVLLDVDAGEREQPPAMVSGVDHLGLHHDLRVAVLLVDLDLRDVEAQLVQLAQPLLDPPPLVLAHGLRRGQQVPEPLVPLDHRDGGLQRVDDLRQQAGHLQVQQLTGDVGLDDVEILQALPVRQALPHLAGLGVHQIGGQRSGVPAEQRVRQRAVLPGEADQVQPDQQFGQRVQQLGLQVRVHPPGEQGAVGQREPQVLGDQRRVQRFALRGHPVGDHPDRLHHRDARPWPVRAAARIRARPGPG